MQDDLALDAERRMAALWRRVRWAGAVFCLVQFLTYRPGPGVELPYDVFVPGLVLTALIALVNLAAARYERVRQRGTLVEGRPARRDLVLLAADLAVVTAVVLLLAPDRASVLWPLLVLPLLEGGLLGGLAWALRTWGATLAVLVVLEVLAASANDTDLGPAPLVGSLGYRAGVLLLVALVVGVQATNTGRYVRMLHLTQERLAHEASHDTLTEVAGRSLFLDRAERALRDQRERGGSAGVLFVDCDQFKTVNDTYGHAAGDEVLVQVAQRLRSAVRPADTVARLGGDEFGVLLERLDGPEEATRIAARVRAALADAYLLSDGRSVSMGCSVGLGVDEGAQDSLPALLRRADDAMYRQKTQHRRDGGPGGTL